ncbi:tail assembly protein [Paracoccus aminophilus]|uniref:Phage tail assembly protein n=1 Tax=Paracoccus aminophilus JCM 7686 TaxID=1367847 RepID=S5Y0K6_PARAH|nr:tail assembly protein [Paracoccus aminophilus]AGT09265.1 phage tail assembly protein [Paracoccus aminophilus JCM 7686]
MNDLYLHGALGKEFGRHFRFDIETIQDALMALRANFPTFANAIRNGFYEIVVGKTRTNGLSLEEAQLAGFRLGQNALHIVPVAAGRKRGGLGKIIAGIALIGLSAATAGGGGLLGGALWAGSNVTGSQIVGQIGTGMLLTGASSLIAPQQKAEDTTQSFTMSGPTSNLREGAIVPIAYGEVVTGGYMISGGISIERNSGDKNDDASAASSTSITIDTQGGSLRERVTTPGGASPTEDD